jgi:sugar phosphate permease
MQLSTKWPILFLIWLMMLVAYFDRINIAVAGPSISAALHLTKYQFGWVVAAFTFGYAVMQVPGGHFADRIGSRPLLVAAILIWSVFTALTGLAASFLTLIAIRVLFGFGEGIEIGPQFKLIGDYFTPKERSQANSVFLSALALGPALATPLATKLIGDYGWREMFFAFSVPGLALAVLLFVMLPRKAPGASALEAGAASIDSKAGMKESMRQPAALCCAATYFFFNATFWGFLSWVPTYLTDQRHITLKNMGIAGSIPYFCGFIGMVAIGHLGSTKLANRRAALVAGCCFASALFLYFAMKATEAATCVGLLSAAAFFIYSVFGPFWAVAVGLAAPASRGAFSGLVNFCGQVGAFSGQIIIGFLADRMKSFDGAILFMVATISISGFVMIGLDGSRRSKAELA